MAKRYKELDQNKFHIVSSSSVNVIEHGHDFLEFTYIVSGSMEHTIGGKTEVVNTGEYFIVDHGTTHSYKAKKGATLTVVNLLFFPEFIERTLSGCKSFEDVVNSYLVRFSYKSLSNSPTGKAFVDKDSTVSKLLEGITIEYDSKSDGYLELIRCKLIEILIITMRKVGKSKKKKNVSIEITDIVNYIKEHYSEKISLSELAKKYNYSLSYISKKFDYEIGMGFSDYLQSIRIEQSCKLLESTDLRIGEIASRVGYVDTKFFNKVFKKRLGISPREFKRLHR